MKPFTLPAALPLLLVSGTALAHPGHDGAHLHDLLAVALLAFLGLLAVYLVRSRGASDRSAAKDAP